MRRHSSIGAALTAAAGLALFGCQKAQPVKQKRPSASPMARAMAARKLIDPDKPGGSRAAQAIAQAVQIKRAEDALQSNRPDDALAFLGKALTAQPGSARAGEIHFLIGRAHDGKGETQKALVAFEKAVALTPDNPEGHYLLALTYKRLKRLPDARKAMKKAVTLGPRRLAFRLDLSTIELEMKLNKEGELSFQAYEKLRNDYIAQARAGKIKPRLDAIRELGAVDHAPIVTALIALLEDPEEPIRAAAAHALARTGTASAKARQALSGRLTKETKPHMKKQLRAALARLIDKK